MKRTFLTLIILATALTALAQATQPCIVKQYNQKQQKTPLAGVQVEVRGAQTATSAANGAVTLQFTTLKPGDRVPFRAATKAGYELMNKTAVEQWNISRDQKPFEIVLIQSAYFTQLKGKLKQSSVDSYHEKYEQTLAELERQKKEGKLKEQEYYDKLNELEDRYDNQLKNLDAYVDQFARIDLSELSEQEQQFIELAHAGRLDEAAEAYNTLNAAGKYITAVENVRRLNEDIAKLEDEKAHQQETAQTFFAMLQRQVNTLKLAGGEENYRKAAELLKRAALADTTNVEVVFEYAIFSHNQKDFKKTEQFYLICLNGSKDDLSRQAVLQQNLGILYTDLHDYAKAEDYLLKALENYTLLFTQNPDAFRYVLVSTQNNLGSLYFNLHDYAKAEEYMLKALENKTLLFTLSPDTYRASLAMTQNNLGNLYRNLHGYAKSEDYYLQALENYTLQFKLNPDANRVDLATTQNNLGNLYSDLHDYAKAEEYYLKALENYTHLFTQNPDAYRASLAMTHGNLGNLYSDLHDYAKAEEYYLKALENYTHLFSQNPDAYRANLATTQNNLGAMYDDLHDYAKAEEYYLKALDNKTHLFTHNPDAYRADLASTQNNLGALYEDLHDYAKAEEYYLKALENYTHLFTQNPDAYRDFLASTQRNLMLLYESMENWEKYVDMFEKTLKNYEELARQNPQYQKDLENLRLRAAYNKLIALYLYSRANEYAQVGNFAQAIENIDRALTLDPKSAIYYASKIEFLLKKGDEQAAEKTWRKAKELDMEISQMEISDTTTLESLERLLFRNPEEYRADLAFIQSCLGDIFSESKDYDRSEEYYLKALDNYTLLFTQNPDAYRADLSSTQYNLGNLYYFHLHDYAKAEGYYLKALENRSQLFVQNTSSNNCNNLAWTQFRLGSLYNDLHDYTKAEEFYLKALENRTQLFSQNPDAYRENLADTQHNLGNLYYFHLHDYGKAEEYYLKALENRSQLFVQDSSSGNCNDLAWTQFRLGSLYCFHLNDYAKSEEYYLKALKNFTQLFTQNSDAYRANLAMTQGSLGNLYNFRLNDYSKAEEYILKALENYTRLFSQNPDDYRADLSSTYNILAYLYTKQNNFSKALETIDRAIGLMPEDANLYDSKGEILLMKGDEQEAVKMWQKVLEVDPDFLKTHNSDLYKLLKEKGLIND